MAEFCATSIVTCEVQVHVKTWLEADNEEEARLLFTKGIQAEVKPEGFAIISSIPLLDPNTLNLTKTPKVNITPCE